MKKWERYNYILRIILYIIFFIDIFFRNKGDATSLIIYSLILTLAISNDYLRYNYFYKRSNAIYYTSIIASIVFGGVLKFFVGGYIEIYLYIILFNIAFLSNRKAVKYLYTLNVLVIIFVPVFRIASLEGVGFLQVFIENPLDIFMILVLLFFSTTTMFSYRALIIEKNKVEKLNKEIEELAITKERNRVAQEIHDNLGHNLVALNMNLDVVGNMVDKEDEIEEIIIKCQRLTKDSMENLRRAVYALKDKDISQGLIKSIAKLIHNIDHNSNIDINYNIDDKIEEYPTEYTNIIYSTLKEGITNSIKHSNCSEMKIYVEIGEQIYMTVKDNGIGCEEIVKGNGLIGIEERVNKIGGQVSYITKKGKGFIIDIKLPL
ncbi:putative Integral membrane sensor signal transduction histidine kinase [[Clostridium] ultunense Esp]|uniref:sensor histidine kinase n=1 Tax=Schnuerera ultunensis TaxID=45497 RepID=UPI0002B7103E|nr:sensor histidine kinase [Schnuerera ultunensis]CCQ92801.1 putative Integral membrane sensor signal transduction histidine kinase [[Clostridium] ultunense Esp]